MVLLPLRLMRCWTRVVVLDRVLPAGEPNSVVVAVLAMAMATRSLAEPLRRTRMPLNFDIQQLPTARLVEVLPHEGTHSPI